MAARTPKIPARDTLLSSSLDGMDDLFAFKTKDAAGQPSQQGQGKELAEMDFDKMEPFPNHKFKLYTGQRLADMVESVKEYGILEPVILWKHEDRHTILSGHNRVNAAKLAGLTKGPVIIRENLTHEDAVLIVTETNLRQRSFDDLSPSEKALCLKQHYDAIKSQGRRNDLLREIEGLLNPHEIKENRTLSENQTKLRTDRKMGEEYGLGRDKVAKYIRIAGMAPPLLQCLDEGKFSFEAAYDFSFVREESLQLAIADMIGTEGLRVGTKTAGLIHSYAKSGKLTLELARQILAGEKTGKLKGTAPKPVRVREAVISRYFTGGQSRKEIEETIEKALEWYFLQNGTEKERPVG